MKRIAVVASLILFVSGCSYTDFLPASPSPVPPPPSETPTIYMTATETPTVTATQPTPTYTTTPTLIYPNGVPPPSDTATPVATTWRLATATPSVQSPLQPLQGNGPFSLVLMSGRQLFWGSCDPNTIKATVKVQDGVPARGVMIMLRLKDVNSNDTTTWGGGAIMDKQGDGVFTYTLTAKSWTHYHDYLKAWGQYQFVAYDVHLNRLGASQLYLDSLTLAPCP